MTQTLAIQHAIETTGLTKAWVIEMLRMNAERALQVREVIGPDGNRTGAFGYQGAVANRALELIGKELGMFIERRLVQETDGLDALSTEQLEAIARGEDVPGLRGRDARATQHALRGARLSLVAPRRNSGADGTDAN